MILGLQIMERTQPGWMTVELKHIRNLKTAAKGSRIANHVWPHEHVSNLTNGSIFDKGNYRLEGVSVETWHTITVLYLNRNTDKILM